MSPPASNEKDPPGPSERFYIHDTGMAVFKVEDRLYKVHRYFLIRESSIFASMFADCPPPGDGQDGDTDAKPIYLPYTTCSEFEALLEFLYYGMFRFQNLKKIPSVATITQRSSTGTQFNRPWEVADTQQKFERHEEEKICCLFDIADRYGFDNITKHLVVVIDANQVNFDPVRKMLIGSKHDDLRPWIMPAFEDIVKRSKGLTVDEMRNLGFERAAEICIARERFYKEPNFHPSESNLSQAFYRV